MGRSDELVDKERRDRRPRNRLHRAEHEPRGAAGTLRRRARDRTRDPVHGAARASTSSQGSAERRTSSATHPSGRGRVPARARGGARTRTASLRGEPAHMLHRAHRQRGRHRRLQPHGGGAGARPGLAGRGRPHLHRRHPPRRRRPTAGRVHAVGGAHAARDGRGARDGGREARGGDTPRSGDGCDDRADRDELRRGRPGGRGAGAERNLQGGHEPRARAAPSPKNSPIHGCGHGTHRGVLRSVRAAAGGLEPPRPRGALLHHRTGDRARALAPKARGRASPHRWCPGRLRR